MKDNEELRKLIESNPNLPLVFIVPTENIDYDYTSYVFQYSSCYVSEVYFDDEHYTDDVEDMIDNYRDRLADEEGYKDLSDDEYDKAVEKYVNENIEHYKAIVVSVY